MEFNYTVNTPNLYNTVRDVLKNYFLVSSRLLLKLKNNNCVFLNNKKCSINSTISLGDIISFSLDYDEDNSNIVATNIPLNIVYEDDCLLIINKQPNIAIHPSMLHYDNSLSNGVKFYFDSIGLKKKIRPVNRLDRNTSGLVIFAKNEYVQEFLIKQMQNNTFSKEYLAILEGTLDNKYGTINAPIARKKDSIIERCVDENGDTSITHYKVIKEFNNLSLVNFKLETGRTHQIRVHSSYIGHPILGDDLYGNKSDIINRQALHSYKISFTHSKTRKKMCFEIDLPKDMLSILNNELI